MIDRPSIWEARGSFCPLALILAIVVTAASFVGFAVMRDRGVGPIPHIIEARP